ncbi:MAG: hypothetical protein K940chlam7_00014 [Chlamydiae bacterium]|nr:hypothetical protein [Chlamydiota bacterium]
MASVNNSGLHHSSPTSSVTREERKESVTDKVVGLMASSSAAKEFVSAKEGLSKKVTPGDIRNFMELDPQVNQSLFQNPSKVESATQKVDDVGNAIVRKTRKKRKKKKKPNSTDSSNHQAREKSEITPPRSTLFSTGIEKGKIRKEALEFLSEEDKKLVQEIVVKWKLGGVPTFGELLGLEIEDRFNKVLESKCISNPYRKGQVLIDIKMGIEQAKTQFEACFCFAYVSLLAEQSDLMEKKYFDGNYLMTRLGTRNMFEERVKSKLKESYGAFSFIIEDISIKYAKVPKIKKTKIDSFRAVQNQVQELQKLIDLCLSFWESEDVVELLIGNTTLGLAGEEFSTIEDLEVGFEHLTSLVCFQDAIFSSAFKERIVSIQMVGFEKFLKTFPKSLSKLPRTSLIKLFQEILSTLNGSHKGLQFMQKECSFAKKGTLTHTQWCEKQGIDLKSHKTQNQFTASLLAMFTAGQLMSLLISDVYMILDEHLLPKINSSYSPKGRYYNRMLLNFSDFMFNTLKPPNINLDDYPTLSSSSFFESLKIELEDDFSSLEKQYFLKFPEVLDSIVESCKRTVAVEHYLPIVWLETFEKMRPMLTTLLPHMYSQFQSLKSKYLDFGKKQLAEFPIPVQKSAVEEFRELILKYSLNICRITMIYADFKALMDMYDEEELELEGFLLPDSLRDLLALEELDEIIPVQLAPEPEDHLEPVEENREVKKAEEKSPRPRDATMKEAATDKKPVVAQKKETHTKKPIKQAAQRRSFSIPRGAKTREILQSIKKELGLSPERISGSHMIFKSRIEGRGNAVLPYHGGGATLPLGTAKSLESQLRDLI